MAGTYLYGATPSPNVGSPQVLIFQHAPEPRYNVVPTLDGNLVVQHLGYVQVTDVTILWAANQADGTTAQDLIESYVRNAESTYGSYREGEVNVTPVVGPMLTLYNATVRLSKFTPTGAI